MKKAKNWDLVPDNHKCCDCGRGKNEVNFSFCNGSVNRFCNKCYSVRYRFKKEKKILPEKEIPLTIQEKINNYFKGDKWNN